ncbi:MAG TPA: lamin tail domain-containing protein [Chitinophagaceae bacterium]|nr:lamin tail domain-containing protein [Chitinophagaceae bacterium]
MKYVFFLLLLFLVCWVKAQDPGRYDVVIHEIFADPTPSRGLPASEFIELRNRSSRPWNLRNWTISNGSATGRIATSFELMPDSLVILCGSSSAAALSKYGTALTVTSFPSLDNDGDSLILSSPSGVVHALVWNKSWYGNDVKMEGGWSLEMIDKDQPCLESSNWLASMHIAGGTPGRINSIAAIVKDTVPPQLAYGYFRDSVTMVLHFSEPLATKLNWALTTDPPLPIIHPVLRVPLFNELEFHVSPPQLEESLINVEARGIRDCGGNEAPVQTIKTGVFSKSGKADIVVNEILFDPPVGGCDYIELYNKSKKNIDVSELRIANRGTDNRISSITALLNTPFPFLPGEYLLISTNNEWVFERYQLPPTKRSIQLPSMPTYPDDQGEVIVLNDQGELLDELNYDQKWHFSLINDKQGISLERISAEMKTNDPSNWHSASTSSGYGTPGYRNSQTISDEKNEGAISLSSKVFSPDMDGRDDFLLINYQFPKPGNVAYVSVFDSQGRMVSTIATASLCGISGHFRWDGLNNYSTLAPRGVYIILTEIFDLQGKTKKYRHTVALYR